MDILGAAKISRTVPDYEFASLMEAHGVSVYRFCRSLTYSKEDADDLFQETFLRAFEQQSKIKISDNAQSFLFSTAFYTWKSWKRKYARRKRLASAQPPEDTAACGSAEESLIVGEEIRIVRELVKMLPDRFRIPVIMYYTAEMSVPDIALFLNVPAGTVKSRLFKARKLIEKGLIEYEA